MSSTVQNLHPVHAVYDGLFNSFTCKKIDLIDPHPHMIDIEDIAMALSNICRFGGHCRQHYNVAQHSVFVCALAPDHLKKEALLHDASEAYVGDVIKPLKVMLGDVYEKVEERFMQCITVKFGLDPMKLLEVKQYDRQALEAEFEMLMKTNDVPYVKMQKETGLYMGYPIWEHDISRHTFRLFYQRYFCKP